MGYNNTSKRVSMCIGMNLLILRNNSNIEEIKMEILNYVIDFAW